MRHPPTSAPEPTSEPTTEPTPGTQLRGAYEGEFSSNTGTALNLVVKWVADRGSDGNYSVTFRFYLDCYTIDVGSREDNTLKITTPYAETEYRFATDAVERYEDGRGTVKIGETKLRLTAEELVAGAKAEAAWKFRGSYSKTELPVVTAVGEVRAD